METERLIIRRFCPDDWQDLYEYLSDEKVVESKYRRKIAGGTYNIDIKCGILNQRGSRRRRQPVSLFSINRQAI